MIWNIIDNRKRRYRWREVNAIIEAVEHDNSCADADQAPETDPSIIIDYDSLESVSVHEAMAWADKQRCAVTLYLYDKDDGFADDHYDEMGVRFDLREVGS